MTFIDTLNQYSGLIGLMATLGVAGLAFFVKAHVAEKLTGLVSAAEHDSLVAQVGAHANRLAAIEAKLAHLPTAQAMHSLALNLNELRGDLKQVSAELHGTRDMLKRLDSQVNVIDSFLRNAKT